MNTNKLDLLQPLSDLITPFNRLSLQPLIDTGKEFNERAFTRSQCQI